MANLFLNIPVPAANGAGAAVDVSAMGKTKSLICGGGFQATVNVEYSTDLAGAVFAPLASFQQSGNLTIDVAAHWMRAVVSDYKGGAPNLDVGANDSATLFAELPDGGGAVDISALPIFKTVVTPPSFAGNIELSEDGVSWAQIFSFQNGGGKSRDVVGSLARVSGDLAGGSVFLAGANEGDAGMSGQFIPARTLFVSPDWPSGVDPLVYFTTIADALVQAATLAPTQASPVAIHVYPGTYPENISLIPWVSVTGTSGAFVDTIITGAITYTPTGAVTESVFLYHLLISTSLTANMTGKTGGQTGLIIFNCSVQSLNVTGRAASGATRDMVQIWNSIPGSAPVPTFNTCFVNWNACRFGGLVFNGACIFAIGGCETLPGVAVPTAVNGTTVGTIAGSSLFTPWNLAAGTSVSMGGCFLNANLTVAAGAAADVRGCNYAGNAHLIGPGTINRTTHTQSFGPTIAGANPVVFAVPFPDAAYNVQLQLTAGPGNAAVTVTAKAGAGFTINDAVGGNTYDITVTHD